MRTNRPARTDRPARTHRPALAAAAVALFGLASIPALPPPPAGAHSGGRAQLYADSIRLEPQPGGWQAALVLRDADSGEPEPGFAVKVTASDPTGRTTGPIDLADPDADGRYEALMPVTEGPWTLTVEAGETPGGARALPFRKTWPITLRAGQPVDVAGPRPPAESDSGLRIAPLALGVMAAATLSGLVTLALSRSRRKDRSPASHPA